MRASSGRHWSCTRETEPPARNWTSPGRTDCSFPLIPAWSASPAANWPRRSPRTARAAPTQPCWAASSACRALKSLPLTEEQLGPTLYAGNLTGIDLQIIEKTGWDAKTGYPVQGIPTPVPGSNPQEQTLKVELPWPPPSPHAPIYVWLRGETTGRLTDVKY